MNYGLMIDDVKTEKVTAQLVVYNAELGYFGNVMVFFEFSEGGKVQVTHSVNTIKVELYDSDADMFRLGMEVVLCLGVAWSVYEELMDVFETKKHTGTYSAYFASVWNYVDVASISLHVLTLIMWFTFGFSLAASFAPDIHYDIYKNLEASAFVTNLKVPNQMVEMGAMFLEMKSLVEYLQLYMTFSGINIMLLLGRILKLMDFQPRLGVITHTLALATADLTHFFVIFAMIFMGYAFIGHVIFGYSSSHFADITASVNSLFQNLLGDITYFMEDFKTSNGLNFVVAMIYFYTFNIFVFMILFNFLLAIICDAFGEVKANASGKRFGDHRTRPDVARLVAHDVPLLLPQPRSGGPRAATAEDLEGREPGRVGRGGARRGTGEGYQVRRREGARRRRFASRAAPLCHRDVPAKRREPISSVQQERRGRRYVPRLRVEEEARAARHGGGD
jgi:hypothetical protein